MKELKRKTRKVGKKASERKPPRRARKKAVPMKLVTEFEDLDGLKCM